MTERSSPTCVAGLLLPIALALPVVAQGDPTPAERRPEGLYPDGEVHVWAFVQGDTRIGHCRSEYLGTVDLAGVRAHRFGGEVRLVTPVAGGQLEQAFTCDLFTNDRGHALALDFRSRVGEAFAGLRITLDEDRAQAVLQQGVRESERGVDLAGPVFALANNFPAHMELALWLDPTAEGEATSHSFLSVNSLRPFPYRVTSVAGSDGRRFEDSLGETLQLDAAGRLERVEVAGLVLRRVEESPERVRIEPPASAPPADLWREEVRIEREGLVIAGTLTRPKDVEGPLPGVFFVSGSGAQDREGYSSGIDLGTGRILDHITEAGFCVLRVDDRGAGASSSLPPGATFDDLVEDARLALRFLRARDEVDRSRVFVIGHSEGGQTAPLLAAQEPGLAGIVLMAAPGRGILELLHEQLLRARRLAGASEEELETLAEELEAALLAIAADEEVDPAEWPPELEALAGSLPWIRSHARQDPLANLAEVTCPVLILQGARDVQVSAERDAPRLLEVLEEAGHADHQLVVFPELDHLFKRSRAARGDALEYFQRRPVDPEFLEALTAWLSARG